jgi:hypothetical protein
MYIFNELEKWNVYAKRLRDYDKYRQNLSNFNENLLKIGILSPGITTFSSRIESRRN